MQNAENFGESCFEWAIICITCVRLRAHPENVEKFKSKEIKFFGFWKNVSHTTSTYEKSLVIDLLCIFFHVELREKTMSNVFPYMKIEWLHFWSTRVGAKFCVCMFLNSRVKYLNVLKLFRNDQKNIKKRTKRASLLRNPKFTK